MARLASLIGRVLLVIATGALAVTAVMFLVGSSLAAYPVMRLSPRARRMRALVNAGAALMVVAQAYGLMGSDYDEQSTST